MRNRRAAMSRIVIVVVAIPIRNRLLVNDRVRHGDRDRDGVKLRWMTVVDWRLIVGVVVASVRGGMVVVRRVVVVRVVVVWIWTSRGVRGKASNRAVGTVVRAVVWTVVVDAGTVDVAAIADVVVPADHSGQSGHSLADERVGFLVLLLLGPGLAGLPGWRR